MQCDVYHAFLTQDVNLKVYHFNCDLQHVLDLESIIYFVDFQFCVFVVQLDCCKLRVL